MLKFSQIIYCYFHSSLNKSILPRIVCIVFRSFIHLETELCKKLLSTSLVASPRKSRDEKGVSTWIPFRKLTSFISLASRHLFYSSFYTRSISKETHFSGKGRNRKTSKDIKWCFSGICTSHASADFLQSLKDKEIWTLLFSHTHTDSYSHPPIKVSPFLPCVFQGHLPTPPLTFLTCSLSQLSVLQVQGHSQGTSRLSLSLPSIPPGLQIP